MGRLYQLIQDHMDGQLYPVSERQVAKQLGVTQTTLGNWRNPKRLIHKDHLIAISHLTGKPYVQVRDALLEDIGYAREEGAGPQGGGPGPGRRSDESKPRKRA